MAPRWSGALGTAPLAANGARHSWPQLLLALGGQGSRHCAAGKANPIAPRWPTRSTAHSPSWDDRQQRPAQGLPSEGVPPENPEPVQLGHDESYEDTSARAMPSPFASSVPFPDLLPSSSAVRRDRPPPLRPSDPASRRSSSGHATTAVTTQVESPVAAAVPQFPGAGRDPDDIEMESVTPSGHRRRRSSLINPANPATSHHHRSTRSRSQSIRNTAIANGTDEPKIVEESGDEDPSRADEWDQDGLSDEDLHDDEETGLTGKDRQRKLRKKRRNQRLDQRIAREKISPEEKKEADRNVIKRLAINCALIGLWYFFSLQISLYNKWMFSPDKLNFRFPMFTTAVHMIVQFSLASLVLFFFPSLRPQNAAPKSDSRQSRHEPEKEQPVMTKTYYFTRIGPCGLATGLDIGLGNTSLQFITLTFYTMCKSSSLAFVLLFAFLFRLESPTWKLVGIIATMTLGVVMMVAGEVEFRLGGFVLVIAAAFFSGFRWALTQILLLRNPATSNPFSSIFFLAPIMFVVLVAIALPVEGPRALAAGLADMAEQRGGIVALLILLFPGVIAFLMTAAEFALLKRTSVVTLSIAGIFKEAVTISAAAIVFGDTMTPVNVIGLLITLVAIGAYNWIKIAKMRREAQSEVHRGHLDASSAGEAFSSGGSGAGSDRDGDDGEEIGLLQQSTEVGEVLFTADGGDMVMSGPEPSGGRADQVGKDERSD